LKKYLSPLEAAEVLEISIHELQQHVSKGLLTLFAPNVLGEAEIELFRYGTTHFFTTPEESLPLGCGLWEFDICPEDCEYLKKPAYANLFCGPELDGKPEGGEPHYPRTRFKLNELIIKIEDLEKIKSLSLKDIKEQQEKLFREALKEVVKLKEDGKEDFEIVNYIESKYQYQGQKLYQIICPGNPDNKSSQQQRRYLSYLRRKDQRSVINKK
jgi:hypothetical protein